MAIPTIVIKKIQHKRADASTWTTLNTVLEDGELGFERDTGLIKIGDGLTAWNSLAYVTDSVSAQTLASLSDINTSTPTNKNFLIADGTDWESRAATLADISDYSGPKLEADLDTELANTRWKVVEVPAGGSTGQVLKKVSGNNYDVGWANDAAAGATNLTYSPSPTNGIVVSDTGDDATLTLADATNAGLLAPADFTKLSYVTVTQAVDLDTMESDIAGKANTSHTHTASDVTDFDTEVSNNASVTANTAKISADGSIGTHSDVDLTGISDGQILKWVNANSRFEPAADAGGGGGANLGYTASPTDGTITNDGGTNATLPLADGTNAGLLAPGDFTKLSNTSGTNTGDQTSIVGITGTKAQFDTAVTDGNFMYTGDAPTAHTHVIADITDFTESDYALVDGSREFTGNLSVSTDGASLGSPRIIGFTNMSSGEGARLQLGDQYNTFETHFGRGTVLKSYNTMFFRAGTEELSAVDFSGNEYDDGKYGASQVFFVKPERATVIKTIGTKTSAYFQIIDENDAVEFEVDENGNISTVGTVDGRDVATDGTKLDGIDSGAEVNEVPVEDTPTTTITLDNREGRYSNMGAANSNTSFSIAASPVLGGKCKMLINAATEPTVDNPDASAARKLTGPTFQANTDMYMHVEWLGATRKADYFFTKITA